MLGAVRFRVCICCGEPMLEKGSVPFDNPNVCAACSSVADELEERGTQPPEEFGRTPHLEAEAPEELRWAA